MEHDVEGLQEAARLLEQAKGAYEKSSKNLKAAMQISLDVQDSRQRATDDFYFLDSHPELGAPVWSYLLPDGRRQGPMSLVQLYPMAHNPTSGVQMDMRIWHASVNTCVSLRDAAAEHPIMQQRFQAMVAAHSAVAAATRAVGEARVARQKSMYRLLQPQANMACLEAGSELWAQCSPAQKKFTVQQIHQLLVEGRAAGKRSFRKPTTGQVQQSADIIVLEYEVLAALKHLCRSLVDCLEEHNMSRDPQALPQLKDIRCWQRSRGSNAKVLYSSESIMELYRADKWPALQRVSHCSDPDDSWSLAAISVACERLSTQIADLSRDPVLILRSKVRAVAGIVEERLASHVKKELRDIVAPAITDAVQRALLRRAANEHMLTQEAPRTASGHPVMNCGSKSLKRSTSAEGIDVTMHAIDVPAVFTHLNGHRKTEGITERQESSALEQGITVPVFTHINGHSRAEVHLGDDSEESRESPQASAAGQGTPESLHLSGGSHPKRKRSSARRKRLALSQAASLAAEMQRPAHGETCRSLSRLGLRSRGPPPKEELHGSCPGSPAGDSPTTQQLNGIQPWQGGAPTAKQVSDSKSGLLHEGLGEQEQQHGRRHRGRRRTESAPETHISKGRSGDDVQDKQANTAPEQPAAAQTASSSLLLPAIPESLPLDSARRYQNSAAEALQPVPEQGTSDAELPSAAQMPRDDAHTADSLQARSVESLLNGIVLRAGDELLALTAAAMSPCQSPKAIAVSGTSHSRMVSPGVAPSNAEHARTGAVPTSGNVPYQRKASPTNSGGDQYANVAEYAKPVQAQCADASEAHALATVEPAAGQALTQRDSLDLDVVPEEPQLLAILPNGRYVFVIGVSRREFLKQREEICTTLSCHQEPTSSNNAGGGLQQEPEVHQDPSRVIVINGRTGAISHPAPGTFEIVRDTSAQHQHGQNRQAGEGASAAELLGPEKALNKRAVKELQELFDSIQETPESRQRRQPVLLSTEQERADQAPRSKTPAKKRPRPDSAKPNLDGSCAAAARYSSKGAAAQQDNIGKAIIASKGGKADRKRQEREEACKQEPFICSRMLPFSKVSRRATAAIKRAKRAIQVAEESSGVNRGVKRRAERNEEILNWRKLKGKEADLKLTKSKVHAWGLVAVKPIEAQQFVIEYTGELIRLSVNANREKLDSDSDYRFRVDDEWVVDATTKGGLARFINHCCDPNCYTKIVTVDSAKHILIFSKRAIAAGEELSYDYKFETTPGEAPIPCTCGAKSCRGRLN